MRSNWWLTTLSVIEIIGLASVLLALIHKKQTAKWFSLFSLVSCELVTNIFLMALLGRRGLYGLYFYIYWGSSFIRAILRLRVIGDVVRTFPDIKIVPANVYLFIQVAGFTMAGASAVYCFRAQPDFIPTLRHAGWAQIMASAAVMLNRCVAIAWASFAVAILAAVKWRRLRWDAQGARIGTGLFLRICINLIVAEMLSSHTKNVRLLANGIDSIGSIAIFSFWVYYILIPYLPERREVGPFFGDFRTLLVSRERRQQCTTYTPRRRWRHL